MKITSTNPSDTNGLLHRRIIIKADTGEEVARFEIPGYPKDLAAYMEKHSGEPYAEKYREAVRICQQLDVAVKRKTVKERGPVRVFTWSNNIS